MTSLRSIKAFEDDDRVFDDADALIALAQQSFTNAAEAAVAENDRMGVPTHGATNGKLTIRHPSQKVESLDPE